MKPIITVEGVSKRYIIGKKESYGSLRDEVMDALSSPFRRLFGGAEAVPDPSIWALKDISFEVFEGDVLGIIGRNGAGKSTLLKILSRITEPTEGRIEMRGRIASLLEVGTGFHPELTGRENIFMNGALLGMSSREIKAKFDEIVAFSEIEKFLDTPVKRYSSGMYVRLAFAVAAHLEPEILIVDEVLAVGDAAFQKKCLGKMGEVAKGGRTVLFVSHNMGAVQKLCTRAVLLEMGSLMADGLTENILNRYLAGSRQTSRVVDFLSVPRQGSFGQAVKISACRLLDSAGRESDTFKFGEPFSVAIECLGFQNLSDLQFVVGINSSHDLRISTIVSPGGFSISPNVIRKGTLRVDGITLNPGMYFITIGIRDSVNGYDHLVNIISFTTESIRQQEYVADEMIPFGLVHLSNPDWKII